MGSPIDIYDVNQYSDLELFNILDINNPTDGELEAKILSQIDQYSKDDNPLSKQLSVFYTNVYERFFGEDEADIDEQKAEVDAVPYSENQTPPPQDSNYISIVDPSPNNPPQPSTYDVKIIVDSQYRNPNTYSLSTNFSFNLSTTIKNVNKMTLTQITVPLTYYNIKSGENSFSIIETNREYNDDYVVKIPVGTYTNNSIMVALNSAIANLSNTYTDVSFGNTNISLTSELKTTLTIDISKHYSENTYKLFYVADSQPNDHNSIKQFLGFTESEFDFSSVISRKTLPSTTSALNYNISIYSLTEANKYFKIVHYVPNSVPEPTVYNTTSSTYSIQNVENNYITVLNEYTFTMTLATGVAYSRNALQVEVNRLISTSEFLTDSGLFLFDTSDNLHAYYAMSIFLNRHTTSNTSNSKIAIVFSQDTTLNRNIWVGTNSAFNFDASINELNIKTSENPATSQTTPEFFDISSNPQIQISCTKHYYIYTGNNYTITVPNGNYIINEYIDAINEGINETNTNNASTNGENPNGVLNLSNAYINTDNIFSLELHIQKLFDEGNFYYVLGDFWHQVDSNLVDTSYNNSEFQIDVSQNATYTTDNSLCLIIKPKNGIPISPDLSFNIYLPPDTSYNNSTLAEAISTSLFNFSTTATTTSGSLCNYEENTNELIFKISLNDALLISDFDVTFIDTANTWDYLDISENVIIDMSGAINPATIKGSSPLDVNTLTLHDGNNILMFRPNSNITNDTLTLVLPITDSSNNPIKYTPSSLIEELNTQLKIQKTQRGENITENSYFTLISKNGTYYTQMYININQDHESQDYSIIFYTDSSNCVADERKDYNASLNTLGASLGYDKIIYNLLDYPSTDGSIEINAENQISLNPDQYFLLSLDDYTQSYTNGNIVTAIDGEIDNITIPRYAKSSLYTLSLNNNNCQERISGITDNNQIMTQDQFYAAQTTLEQYENDITSLLNTKKNGYTNQLNKSNVNNILAVINLKENIITVDGESYLSNGVIYTTRVYNGPVNISRLSVKLLDSKGNILDLNGRNWSFVLKCEVTQ